MNFFPHFFMENCQQVESTTPCSQDNIVVVGGGSCGDVGNNSNSLNRDSPQGAEFISVDQCQKIPKMDDSQLVGNADVAVPGDGGATVKTETEKGVKVVDMTSAGKRRRGRPPRNQARIISSSAPPPPRNKKDEEDVCFICFDGGSLVLCDRRGCPKAYHPACIKRDEAFFKSKAKWNCGWHICSNCQKASYYMCYTCTYSLCKNCTKDADYVNVRGNKGFCGTCMKTVMLIENSTLGNKEMVQVDFDDKTSWEYLFKVYWVFLKEKLSLSLDELTKAKNPWKEIAIVGPKGDLSGELNNGSNAKGGKREKSFGDLRASSSKRRKTMKQQKFLNKVESLESHFLIQDHLRPSDTIRGGGTEGVATQLAVDWKKDGQPVIANDKSCKTNEKVDEKGQKTNPDVCGDPNMNLFQKSEEVAGELDENKKGNNMKRNNSVFGLTEEDPASPLTGDGVSSDTRSRETSIPLHSTGMELSVNNTETENIWHYQDPHGKIQGPFPMAMLRRWSMSGQFPSDLRIWRISEKQDDSILLTDALEGRYSQVRQLLHNSFVPTEGIRIFSDEGCQNRDGDARESRDLNVNQMENKQVEGSLKSMQNDASGHFCGNNESVKSKELGSQSSPCTVSVDIVNSNAVKMGIPLLHWDSVKDDNYFPGQPQVSSSLPSSIVSGKPCETQSHQVSEGHGVERWDCGSIDMNKNLNKNSEGQIIAGNVKQDDSDRKSGISCGRSGRSSPLNDASNGWDLNSGLISLATALEISEHNQDIDFPNLPTSTSKLNHNDSGGQATEDKQSHSSHVSHQDSGPGWSTASSLVGNGSQLPEAAGEWDGYSSTPAKPSAEEWNSDLVHESSVKPTDLGNNHSATRTSGNGQLTHSSPTDPANNASGWDSIVPEPSEYTLGDKSVSDLLAEVEAMESLNGLPSPTSLLRCDGELAEGSEHNCFSPLGGLSLAPDPGKSDDLSSTNDLQIPSQSTVTDEPFGVSKSEVLDAHKSSGGHSSTSLKRDEDTRPSYVSVKQHENGSDMQPPAPPVTTWSMASVDTAWKAGPETTGINLAAVQRNANFNWEGLGQGTTSLSRGTYRGTFQENGSISSGTSTGNPPYSGSQQRYVGPRDRDFQGRESNFGRGRYIWNRQSAYGGPNGVGSFRPTPKGQRVCKFYESGYCKKGASCSYWHP